MNQEQITIISIIGVTIIMFLWGRWRHDMVAVASLLACVVLGLVPSEHAFAGFGHPAVVTVACVLVLSNGLQHSGAVDVLVRKVLPQSAGNTLTIFSITALAGVLSAFINNVGALALLMPVAIQTANRREMPVGKLLMPLAFGSILGGMITLIGTPSNLIVASFSAKNGDAGFAMFDFTPVGLVVALIGVAFITLIGWRLVPSRKRSGVEDFDTGAYLTEAIVTEKGKADGLTLSKIEETLDEVDAQIIALIRNKVRMSAPNARRKVLAGDILVIEADPEALTTSLSHLNLQLVEAIPEEEEEGNEDKKDNSDKKNNSEDVVLMELAVLPSSSLEGRSMKKIHLRSHYNINMLALSRQGKRSMARLRTMSIRIGDVLLMQGTPEMLSEFASAFGCVPLAERTLRIPNKKKAWIATGVMAASVSGAAFGFVPATIAFVAGMLAVMAFRLVPPRKVYNVIDWPVIVLLGALIPVAGVMATTGAADLIAHVLLDKLAQGNAVIALAVILVVTMTLSDFMSNAATAAMMCPIALGTAEQLYVNSSPFLMAVAVGASCAFLTPIGHQNNTLILGPGGFHFGDYWKLGLPLEIIVVAVSIPMILMVWPL